MSIATEIARLQQAKADLKASINAKGGTITNETIDEYASKVSALPSPKEEETKTVTPNFSSGNVVVTPTSGKVLSQVTINKDSNLIADNIKKDITVHGITGTLESGGGLTSGIYFPRSGSLWKTVQITISGKTTVTMDNTEINYMPLPADWLGGTRTLNITITNNADSRKSGYSIINTAEPLSTSGGGYSTNSTYTSSISAYIDANTVIVINADGTDPI